MDRETGRQVARARHHLLRPPGGHAQARQRNRRQEGREVCRAEIYR